MKQCILIHVALRKNVFLITNRVACLPGNVHFYGAANCILNVSVSYGVISTCVR